MTGSILSYLQADSIRLLCEINRKKLLPAPKERNRFDKNWNDFLESDPCNKKIFERKGDLFRYKSEQLIPTKSNNRIPLLLVLGNPASHSVAAGMFFAFKGNGKENRFWKSLLKSAGVLSFSFDENLPAVKLNALRKKQLLELDYESPFRIGLSVFTSMPSAPGGPYGGVAGVRKLLGVRALRRLEAEESKRITKCAKDFIGDDPRGKIVTFQKNAWNGLKSENSPEYKIDKAKDGTLKGCLKDQPKIPLFGVPPTRLVGPTKRVLSNLLCYNVVESTTYLQMDIPQISPMQE